MEERGRARTTASGRDSSVRSFRDAPPSPGPVQPSAGRSGSAGASGAAGLVMGTLSSALSLVRNPVGHITANKDTPATPAGIMLNYVAVLAAIPLLATLIGDLWYYSVFVPLGFVGSYVAYAFTDALLTYVLDVIGVYVIALVIGALAPSFGSSTDPMKSLKLAAYVFTPVFLIGIVDMIPLLTLLTVLGVVYGLYILYLGLPITLGTPKEKVLTYVVAVVIATLVVYVVIGAIVGAVSAAVFHAGIGFL